MKTRCNSTSYIGYKNYGGRGITYEDRWHHFEYFLADMGECPSDGVLDRIDNNGHYTKENCRWTTRLENNRNSRKTVLDVRKARLIKALLRSVKPGVSTNRACTIIARSFGVSVGAVKNILIGRTWAEV